MYIHEKKKERKKKKKKQRSSSWMCLLPFLPHFPDWKLAFLPPFLFFNCFTCVSYIQRQRQLCLPPCVWVYKASLFVYFKENKKETQVPILNSQRFFNAEEIVSWLLPSSGYFIFSARQSIRLHPNRVMVRLQLQPSCPLVCSHTIALLSFFSWI